MKDGVLEYIDNMSDVLDGVLPDEIVGVLFVRDGKVMFRGKENQMKLAEIGYFLGTIGNRLKESTNE
jgi:hypothetical protein